MNHLTIRPWTRVGAALVIALTLMITGCVGNQPSQSPKAEGPAPSGTTTPAQPKKDGTMIIALPQEPGSLDPQATTSLVAQRVREQLFDSLVAVDFTNNTIVASLAESWNPTADGLTYTFRLRKDVKFHSGKPMTSRDVKYTFDRWRASKSPNSWLIEGLKEVQTPDDHTVVLKLEKPNPELLLNLARSDASILNQESVEKAGKDFGTKVVDGTGPFKLKAWTVKDRIVLERFDEYRWAPPTYQNRGPAHLKEIVWRSIPDEAARLLELESGGIHAIPPRISFHEIDRLRKSKEVQILDYKMGSTVIIGFNPRIAPMDDIKVREAFARAIDLKEIIAQVLYGHADLGVSVVAPGIEGFCEICKAVVPSHDPARAKALLEEAGWKLGPDGIRVKDGKKLIIPAVPYNLPPYPEAYTVLQAQLKDVGIHLDVRVTETSKVFEMYREGTHGVWSTSLVHDTPFQATFNFLHSSANRFAWKDAKTDQLLDEAAASTDNAKRVQAYQQAQKNAMEQYLFVPFFHEKGLVGVSARVKGFKPYGFVNSVFHKMTDTWVEE